MTDPADSIRALFPEQYLRKFIEEGIRPDERIFSAARETSFNRGMIRTADGSASVQLGKTTVVAGVMLSTFRPTVGTPDTGRLEVVVELGTVCSNRFPTWKPSDQAIAISHFVARTLKGAGVVDLKDLIIKKGAAAFILNISVTCLNYDGNVEDAALLAAVLALLDTKLPPVQVSETGEVVECEGEPKKLSVKKLPIALTQVLLINNNNEVEMLADPTAEEEDEANSSITAVLVLPLPLTSQTDAVDTAPVMLHKPGGMGLQAKQLRSVVSAARSRSLRLLPLLVKELK